MMKHFLLMSALCLLFGGRISAQETADEWAPLRPFVGTWQGRRTGMGGDATQETELKFVLGGKFLQCTTKTIEGPDPHTDMGMISYDRSRGKFVYRSFFSEGFVNTYIGTVSEDGNSIEFVSE